MLLDLIPELLEGVFYYCGASELKTLSRCCHDLKDICRGLLWGTVKIPPHQLSSDTFAQDSKLRYLAYTKVLRIHGSFSKNAVEIERKLDMVLHNVQVVLKTCSPQVLDTWFLPEGFSCLYEPKNAIEELRVCKYAVKNSLLIEICRNFPTLRTLNLEVGGIGINDDGMSHLPKLTHLEKLVISRCGSVTDACLEHISALKHLRELRFWAINISDQGMYHLQFLQCLQTFEVTQCNGLTDTGLSYIKQPTLTEISLSDCPRVSNRGVEHFTTVFAAKAHLQKIHLSNMRQLTGSVFSHIARQVSLRELKVASCNGIVPVLHGTMPNVQLKDLFPLKCIEKIDFSYSDWLNVGTSLSLGLLTTLKELNLHGCYYITNRALVFLKTLTALEVLDIADCRQISDEGMVYVSELKQLRELNISRCRGVTNVGARGLLDLVHLKKLHIEGCHLITSVESKTLLCPRQNLGIFDIPYATFTHHVTT